MSINKTSEAVKEMLRKMRKNPQDIPLVIEMIAIAEKYLAMEDALEAEHQANDWLLAQLIHRDHTFLPSKCPVWGKIVLGNEAMKFDPLSL